MVTRVQEIVGVYSSGTTFTVVLAATPQNGNTLILTVHTSNNTNTPITVSSVSSTGASWSVVKAQTKTNATVAVDTQIWAALNVSGASATITVTLSGAAFAAFAFAAEYSAIVTSSATDKTASNSGSGTTPDSGTTSSTTQPVELLVAALTSSSAYTFSGSPSNGFSMVDREIGFSLSGEYCEQIVAQTGTANTSDSTDSYSGIWSGCVATFFATMTTPPIEYTGIQDVVAYQKTVEGQAPRHLSVNAPIAAILPPPMPPGQFSPIQEVVTFLHKDRVEKHRTRLTVQAPSQPIIPPPLTPRAYSGILTVLDFMEKQNRYVWSRLLTVQPPWYWTYAFTVTDTATGTESVVPIAFTLADSGVGTDALGALSATVTVSDSGAGTDSVYSLSSSFSVADSGVGTDTVLKTVLTAALQICLTLTVRPVNLTVQNRSIDISNTERTLKFTVEQIC